MTTWRLAGWVAAVITCAALAGCTSANAPADEASQPNTVPVIVPGKPGEPAGTIAPGQATPVPAQPPNDADVGYVRGMIAHHQQAVEMTALAPERAAAPKVKALADRIGSVQGPEIAMMNGWLRGHGQPEVNVGGGHGHGGHGTPAAGMPGMATPEQLAALRAAAGPAFDRMFLDLMIAHHEGALTMARAVQTTGTDIRVQEMADDVIATQTAEIRRMLELLGS